MKIISLFKRILVAILALLYLAILSVFVVVITAEIIIIELIVNPVIWLYSGKLGNLDGPIFNFVSKRHNFLKEKITNLIEE